MNKTAAVINDLSGFGKCSLCAAIGVLSVMGVSPCALPTAILTNQTGYQNHYSFDFSGNMPKYIEMWKKNNASFDAVYSGYVANKEQVDFIGEFIDEFRKPSTLVLVDPVMADNGRLYSAYGKDTCEKIKELAKKADIITPNLTELCILADEDYELVTSNSNSPDYFQQIGKIASSVVGDSSLKIAVTGIKTDKFIYNGLFERGNAEFFKSIIYGTSFSGTGDIFASIVCGGLLNGLSASQSVQKATAFLEEVIADTVKEPYTSNYGVNYEKFLHKLHISKE